MSNTVSCILSRHGPCPSYRLMLETGEIVTKTNDEVRCMINGDLAIENYEPSASLDGERSEPVSIQQGPQKGDILLVLIDQCRAACEVLDVSTKKGRPLYLVKYDDGMLVQDHLVVPWSYVSTAHTTSSAIAPTATPSTDSKPSVAASASTPVAPSTSKSSGKRRMIDVIPYLAETAPAAPKREAREREIEHEKKSVILLEEMQKAKAAQEAAAGLLPLSHPLHLQPEHEEKRKLEKEEHQKKTHLEKRYGKLLDTIVL